MNAIAEAIADGATVDWSSAPTTGGHQASQTVRELQIIAALAAVHRQHQESLPPATLGEVLSAAAPPSVPGNGTPWGPLIVLEEVGSGSFGNVFRAWDPSLDHEVALKRVRLPAGTSRSEAASIVREGQLLARVRHENVITVHGACEIKGEVGIWMDFVRGKTLDQIVRVDGPMSGPETAVVGESLCRGLAAVHQAGLLHRDIKAANVMREAGGRIVMLDFGTGTEASAENEADLQVMAGTPLYMAPELFEGGAASKQSDIYSLGVLLFFLTTGRYPVNGHTLEQIRAAHQAGRRRLLSDVRADLSPAFVDVVERALSPDPRDRFESAGSCLHDLNVGGARAAPLPRSGLVGRGAAIAAAALAAVLLCLALGFVTSAAFNFHFGRSGAFTAEGPLAYAKWGAMSLVPTATYIGLAVLSFYAVAIVASLVIAGVARLGAPVAAATMIGGPMSAFRPMLTDLQMMCRGMCAVGLVAFAGICWVFRDLIAALTSQIDSEPLETLAVLHPSQLSRHVLYGIALDMLLLMLVYGLYRIHAAYRQGAALDSGPVFGVVALAGLSMLLHAGAWRILYQNDFRQAILDGHTCFVLAQDDQESLVHCPDTPPPRNVVVGRGDTRLQFTGKIENISKAYAPPSN